MKKILISLSLLIFSFALLSFSSYAAELAPVYDASFNNNSGAFYANGTDIIIDKNSDDDTVITWDTGSQIVPSTVTIFGGGTNGTSFETSNITMQNGTVTNIIAGGVSTDENEIANVKLANVTINNGTILNKITGGGYAYAQVENCNITINNATINNIIGGGMASVTINGVYYSVGSAEKPLESPNRVENVTITINDITMPYSSSTGLIYGGGQGYSYVGNNNIIINGGNLSNAYITAGGSNGYTGNSILEFNNGNLGVYQSVNRGIVDSATLKISNGNIETLYIGGETDATDVTGKINNANVHLLYGSIENLEVGKSNSKPLDITSENYIITKTNDVIINNDNIPEGKEQQINYKLSMLPEQISMFENDTKKLNITVSTDPTGYENLFTNSISLNSDDENIATVSKDGTILAKSEGDTTISATLFDKTVETQVTVLGQNYTLRLILLFIVLPLIAILILFII